PFAFPGVIGTAISIILGFRINQAYTRWWEARKIWGAIVNDSRTLVRQLLTLPSADTQREDGLSLVKHMALRQAAWCVSLGQMLRKQDSLANIQHMLAPADWKALQDKKHVPNSILVMHGRDAQRLFQQGMVTDIQQANLDATLARLTDSMGKSERIKNTVFPVLYSRLLHAFLYLFLFLLPLGLIDYSPIITMPVILASSIIFFLIERTSERLQDPFEDEPNDTAVTSIARAIEINIREMLEEKELPEPIAPEPFYVL
ncbi:MAG: bestrophin family ion channel, partial [Bacteroidota bacterium]